MARRAHRQVLDGVIAVLRNHATVGANLFEDPSHAIADSKIPAFIVEPDRESSEKFAEAHDSNLEELRRFSVLVTIFATSPTQRDTLALDVETLINRSKVGRERFFSDAEYERSGQGAAAVYAMRMRFGFEFYLEADRPGQMVVR